MTPAQIEATLKTLQNDVKELRTANDRLRSAVTHLATNPSNDMSPGELAERGGEVQNLLNGQ